MKRVLLLLCALLLLPLSASAVTGVPEGVTILEDAAFANTGIDALIIPASVEVVGANVLKDCNASYLYLKGADTTLASSAAEGVPFVFAPAASSAASFEGFYATETLATDSGLYYAVTETALPLCAEAPFSLSGSVTIPKLLGEVPVTSLDVLYLANTGLTELRVPQYLTIPEGLGMTVTPYETMFITTPAADVAETAAGAYVTWTAEVTGAYGAVSYLWTFDVNGETSTTITAEPTVSFAPMAEGSCTVTVTAEDSLGDSAVSGVSEAVTVSGSAPTYRALLVGNVYATSLEPLQGPDNDVAAMKIMLSSMTGTKYSITTALDLTSAGMEAAIASTFAAAQPGDVSLFYYSGHGTSSGSLVGAGSTTLSIWSLRSALQNIPGTKIVILDCCYSGMAITKASDSSASPSAFTSAVISALSSVSRSSTDLADQGFIVLTSCSQEQLSNSLNDGTICFGAFTYGLCYGSGYDEWNQTALGYLPADADSNGAITLGEAYAGVQEQIDWLNSMLVVPMDQSVQYYGDTSYLLWSK